MGDQQYGRISVTSAGFDPTTPNEARIIDYILGGKDNFAADRDAAEKVLELAPELKLIVREWRKCLRRVVRFLAEAGIRQFIDIEDRLPTQQNVHEVALDAAPDSQVVYVVRDPMVASHARALLQEDSRTVVVRTDGQDPDAVLGEPRLREVIDLDRPVAVLLMSAMDLIADDDVATRLVTGLRDGIAPGSYIAITHAISDVRPEVTRELASFYQDQVIETDARRDNARTRAEVERFFAGLDLAEPGLVFMSQWRPEPGVVIEKPEKLWAVAGVGRKP
jgi:S-adenosyl methyltransferase